jgi:LuxR family maltose regulon positive regulatory protein
MPPTAAGSSVRAVPPAPARAASAAARLDVAAAKLFVPPVPADAVARTPAVNRLRASDSPVVLVTAPAGYGKTTLLAQWAARDPRPFAWVSVDERDGDPIVLVRDIAAALDAIEPLTPDALEALAAPQGPVWTSMLPRLTDALSAAGPLVIVLDDAHLLASAEALEAVAVLADDVPEASALVLVGRAAPRLPLASLRADGKLLEIGVEQLAFTPREGQILLRSAGVRLSFDQVTSLVRECEGWPAALALGGLRRDGSAGADGGLAAYIRREYLGRLTPASAEFLRRTSVLDKLCGGLCDAVLGKSGSAERLASVERANLFLLPLDRERVWFRYQQLFRDVLRQELGSREPDLVPMLHARAADWFEARGDRESALEHSLAAGDLRRAARILTAVAIPLYHHGRVAAVESWLARFDDRALLLRHPTVALQGSWIHAMRGRADEAERWLEIAETTVRSHPRARGSAVERCWISVVRATLCHDGVFQMISDAECALAGIRNDDPLRPSALLALGAGYLLLGQSGRADAILAEAAAEAARLGATETEVVALGERSIIAGGRQDAASAETLALQAQCLAGEAGLDGYASTAIALAAGARAALRHGRWDDARADLDKVAAGPASAEGRLLPWFAVQTRLQVARAHLALRETQTVRSLLVEIRELLREHPCLGTLVDDTEALEREVEAIPQDDARAGLTPAELRLLPFLTTHLSFREIGERLYVSRNTIKTQAISVYRKLGATSRSDAIARAVRLGLVEAAQAATPITPHG